MSMKLLILTMDNLLLEIAPKEDGLIRRHLTPSIHRSRELNEECNYWHWLKQKEYVRRWFKSSWALKVTKKSNPFQGLRIATLSCSLISRGMVTWDFLRRIEEIEPNFAFLILNQPILCKPQLVRSFWTRAVLRTLVDGGCNRWLHFQQENKISDLKLPDFISGDFDSLKPETRTYFENLKANFIHTPDQNETDFTKALRCVNDVSKAKNLNVKLILALCENSGRLDQIIGNLNTLHKSNEILPEISVVILTSESASWVLHPGDHTITVSEDFVREEYACGLMPLCGPTLVSTSGLKWNLENHMMEVGGLVSTSNTFAATKVTVKCDKPLVWTTQYCKIDE